jgi:holliday junction DNA helicase RuvB
MLLGLDRKREELMHEDRATEINDVAPTSLNHIIGQKSVVEQVRVGLDAAFEDRRRMDSCLLVGPPGCGKSAVARIIAAEMATDLHEVIGQSITSPADLNALLLSAKEKAVVHIDECHELRKDFQTTLYLAIDQRKLFMGGGKSIQSLPICNFTLLLSTTDEYCLLQPLRDRMRLVLRFEFYSDEELTTVLKHRAKCLRWEVDEAVLPLIAQRSRGTPRLALRLLQSCYRVCRSLGETSITQDHLQRACNLEQIDELGLGPTEQKYLSILRDGPQRLNVFASLLGLPARTVSQVTEPFLIRAGLVIKDDQGRRQLTGIGYEHAAKAN